MKKEIIKEYLKRGQLISTTITDSESLNTLSQTNAFVLHPKLSPILSTHEHFNDWKAYENALTHIEKHNDDSHYQKLLSPTQAPVSIITSYEEEGSKKEVGDFVNHFGGRYEALRKILQHREELQAATTISRLSHREEREKITLIGIVTNKETTKNNNIILTVEDPTGHIKLLVNKTKPDLFSEAQDIVLDEIIGITGVLGNNIVFVNSLIWPDVPVTNQIKYCPEEGYALFLSDIHVGSQNFLEEDFNRFLDWINLKTGSDKQKEMASKVKYIFVVGDLIDGVGVYPGQEDELTITDATEQYRECTRLLAQIPKHIKLIICPGNHDTLRLAEPQPVFYKDLSEPLYTLENATFVSNPAIVNIEKGAGFEGLDILLYHGYSFDYYAANVDSIRNNGGYDRADLIMKFLLRRRHLAPSHTSTVYVPSESDPLVINTLPDIFASGHIHKSAISQYRGVTLLCASCWQSKTPFQEKVGHNPEPSRVPAINLKTREVKVLRFGQ